MTYFCRNFYIKIYLICSVIQSCKPMKKLILSLSLTFSVFGVHAQAVKSFRKTADRVQLTTTAGELTISPLADDAVRIRLTGNAETQLPELVLVNKLPRPAFQVTESAGTILVATRLVQVKIDKQTGAISYSDKTGKQFLAEIPGSRRIKPDSVMGKPCLWVEQKFQSPADELIYGLGQFQDGHLNLRGITRKLTQVNSQIAIPFIYSNKGYGIYWNQYGLTDFNPADNFVSLQKQVQSGDNTAQLAEVTTSAGTQKVQQNQSVYTGKFNLSAAGNYAIMLDLGDMDNRHFVSIDGKPAIDQSNYWLPPTQSVAVSLAAGEHTVQIICKASNSPKFSWRAIDNSTTLRSPHAAALDYVLFYGPDADRVIASYRNLSGRVPMLPLWAYGFWQCRERYTSSAHLINTVREFRKRKLPVDVIVQDWQYWGKYGWGAMKFDETYYPDPKALCDTLHQLHTRFNISVWENVEKYSEVGKDYVARNLYIPNSRWLDVTNPEARRAHWDAMNKNMFSVGVDSWWLDATEPENDALHNAQTHLGPGDFYRLTYPLFVNQAVYEGQRKTTSDKRVCILTRSAFAGQQRYGTINWSGDINGTWDGFRRQITAGLNYNLTGMPFWTTDIGGFFRPGNSQYTDPAFHELLTRWFQWGAFSPIFRIHGYQTETEPWKYGAQVEENMRKMLELRYRLIPYIYSEAWQVSQNHSTMMRPLVMDFRADAKASAQPFNYMFGQSLLVAPVTQPGVKAWNVALPQGSSWYNFHTGRRYTGGQTVLTDAPLHTIPVYVKAGAILPLGKPMQYTGESPADTLEIRIYPGANGRFELYEDEGDNYNYEQGKYTVIPFYWNESTQTLTIGNRRGAYTGALSRRLFRIVNVPASTAKAITYTGQRIVLKP